MNLKEESNATLIVTDARTRTDELDTFLEEAYEYKIRLQETN